MRRLAVYAAVLLTLAGWTTLGELDDVLKARHPPGAASYGMGDLAGSIFRPDYDRVEQVVRDSWLYEPPPGFADPRDIAYTYAIVDCLFAAGYVSLLVFLAVALARALRSASSDDNLELAARHRLARRDEPVTAEAIRDEVTDLRPLVSRFEWLAQLAARAAPAILLAEFLENLLQAVAVNQFEHHWLYVPLYAATLAKTLLLLSVAVALLLGLFGLGMLHPRARHRFAAALLVARAPMILAAVLALAFLTDLTPFGEQGADVLLGWRESISDAAVAVLLFAWLSLLMLVLTRRLLAPTPESEEAQAMSAQAEAILERPVRIDLRRRVPLRWLALAGALLLVPAGIAALTDSGGAGLWVAAGILVAIAFFSWITGEVEPEPLPTLRSGTVVLPALAAAAPLTVLGLALLQATVAEIAWTQREGYAWWALLGLVLAASGLGVFSLARGPIVLRYSWGNWVLWPTVGLLLYLTWRIWMHPWRVADALGGFGVFAASAAAVLLVSYLLMWPEERVRPSSMFAVLRLRRIPVFALVIIWALVASTFDKGGFHDVRVEEAAGAAAPAGDEQGLSVEQAFANWEARNPAPAAAGGAGGGKPVQPLLLVSSAGGGVRAAYWTGLVLECLFHGRGGEVCESAARLDPGTVFATASASGGSVGLANWLARLRSGREDWLDHLGDDSLTPTLAWTLFVDVPNTFVKFDFFQDRAEVLERTWEQQWEGRDTSLSSLLLPYKRGPASGGPLAEGLFEASDATLPLLILASTSVEDGCRFAVSALDSNLGRQRVATRIEDCLTLLSFERGGGSYIPPRNRRNSALVSSKDLDDYLCRNRDIRLSTAALLSARFPYVSPSGRLVKCNDTEQSTATYLVDGGYFDNTGASPIVELWAALEPLVAAHNATAATCIAPFVVDIDNHYGEPPGPQPGPRPREVQVPLQTLLGTRNAKEANSRQAAALGASLPFGRDLVVMQGSDEVDRFARIYPRAHPGTRAPLGWALSRAARDDLATELRGPQNEPEIEKVHDWFDQNLTCQAAERD